MSLNPELFFNKYVTQRNVSLSGLNWQMVIATLEESADNCFRCKQQGCDVCRMTRQLAQSIEGQLNKAEAR